MQRALGMAPWLAVIAAPLVLLAVLLARPAIDETWENHPAHFWLVLAAAATATALGYAVSVAARRRRDARLFLISLAFVASSGFLGLHALATPGVLLGKNAGFELAGRVTSPIMPRKRREPASCCRSRCRRSLKATATGLVFAWE